MGEGDVSTRTRPSKTCSVVRCRAEEGERREVTFLATSRRTVYGCRLRTTQVVPQCNRDERPEGRQACGRLVDQLTSSVAKACTRARCSEWIGVGNASNEARRWRAKGAGLSLGVKPPFARPADFVHRDPGRADDCRDNRPSFAISKPLQSHRRPRMFLIG